MLTKLQGESEHRVDKSRYDRTGGKDVPENISKLEQRERTIKVIRTRVAGATGLQIIPTRDLKRLSDKTGRLLNNDPAPEDISLQYNIGVSENSPIDLGVFLSRNAGDPAIAVSGQTTTSHMICSFIPGILCEAAITSPSKDSGRAQCRIGIDRRLSIYNWGLRRPYTPCTAPERSDLPSQAGAT